MALVKCPECSHSVSTKAASCPQCGCPITENPKGSLPEQVTWTKVILKRERLRAPETAATIGSLDCPSTCYCERYLSPIECHRPC